MAYNSLKDIVNFKKVDWDRTEERATELWEFVQNNLDINTWEVSVKGVGRLSFLDFMQKCKQQFATGRYIEGSEAQTDLLENIQYLIFDTVKLRFTDVFRSLINTLEEKKMTIEAVEEQLDASDEIVKKVMMENELLKEENAKLRKLNEFSNDGYYELWKIIEVKLDNLLHTYNDFSNITDKEELKSYIDAMRTELRVGKKPIEAKKKFLIMEQLKNLGFESNDFIDKKKEVVQSQVKEEKVPEKEPEVAKPVSEIKIEVDEFKKELDEAKEKSNNDYIVPKEEIVKNKLDKYSTFSVHKGKLYDEDEWINEEEPMGEEEKEIRSNLIKEKLDSDDYILENEVDYSDKSNENKAKIITLVTLDQEQTHKNFGLDSMQWVNRYKDLFTKNLSVIEKDIKIEHNPTILKMLGKL